MVWKFYGKAIRPKLWGNCAFPQNFHTMKLGEITVFYAVSVSFIDMLFILTLLINNWGFYVC